MGCSLFCAVYILAESHGNVLGDFLAKLLLSKESVKKPVVKTVSLPKDNEAVLSSNNECQALINLLDSYLL